MTFRFGGRFVPRRFGGSVEFVLSLESVAGDSFPVDSVSRIAVNPGGDFGTTKRRA